MMKVKINNIPSERNSLVNRLLSSTEGVIDAVSVSLDRSGRYAVVEAVRNCLFVAVNVVSREEALLVGDYVNCYTFEDYDAPMLYKLSVDWSCLKYGFCKLNLWAPEKINEFGGSDSKTLARFYFDWELYKTSYQKRHGRPCTRENPNL